MTAISDLVTEFNLVESEQQERLEALYSLMRARTGYRKVTFKNDKMWVNFWGKPEILALAAQVTDMDRTITEVVEGE